MATDGGWLPLPSASTTDPPADAPNSRPATVRFLALLLALIGLLAAATTLVAFLPNVVFVAVAPAANHVINTVATLIAAGVAVLAWVRYRETGQIDSILQATAFLLLFTGGALTILLLLTAQDSALGYGRASPGQAPLYTWTALRFLAAPFLLAAGVMALRPTSWRAPRKRKAAAVAVLAPTAVGLVAVAALIALRDWLPPLVPQATLLALTQPGTVPDSILTSPPMLLTQLAVAALLLLAGVCYGFAYGRSRRARPDQAYLAIGLVLAAFSQLHFGIAPAPYTELLTTADVLRMAFYGVVGFGIAAAVRHDLRDLREANVTLTTLRESDRQRISLEERARLAREVHDGLVQDLWLARLTHGRMVQALEKANIRAEARESAQRVDSILEDALAEARQAVVSLQPQSDASFGPLLVRFVEDYGDRFGLDVDCRLEGDSLTLPGQTQAEVLRICREAMNNARKHADATTVTVTLEDAPDVVRLTISDNGRGFDTSKPRRGFGLKGMMARALDIGARLDIDSQQMGGTRVVLELPQPRR